MSTSAPPDDAPSAHGARSPLMERLRAEEMAQDRAMTARERASRSLALGRSLEALRARVRRGSSSAP